MLKCFFLAHILLYYFQNEGKET